MAGGLVNAHCMPLASPHPAATSSDHHTFKLHLHAAARCALQSSICARSSLMRALLAVTASPRALASSYLAFSSSLLSSITCDDHRSHINMHAHSFLEQLGYLCCTLYIPMAEGAT